jgi:two-component system sensor histidine kinase MtrB
MATITYTTARRNFINQSYDSATRQAFVNASFVRSALRSPDVDVLGLLTSLDSQPGSRSVLLHHGRWSVSSLSVTQDDLPSELRNLVLTGTAATQYYDLAGVPRLAVGAPVPEVGSFYFEVFSLQTVENNLHVLAATLALAAAIVTLGGALLGRWASGRALRPLSRVADAAVEIAGGRLDTRLETADETDLAALAKSFNRMADSLQARIEHEARFTSDVSHELRSPLTTLANTLGVLEARRHELPERSQRALDLLSAEISRFQRMVADLLEISRFDAGAAELSLDEVQVGDLVGNVVNSLVGPDFPLSMSEEVSRLRVEVDKRRFERVVTNLVENAKLYAGGVTNLSVEANNGTVRISVDDAGPGIRPEDRKRVFERFYRSADARRRRGADGSGLGLALVAEHVHLHGGEVWVEDSPAGGTRFVVELPVSAS